jgi:hypothetical protein
MCWKQAKTERKTILAKKACTRKATTGRKSNMRAYMEDLTTLGLGFLQCIVMVEEPKMYKYRYLGLIGGLVDIERQIRRSGCYVIFCCMT